MVVSQDIPDNSDDSDDENGNGIGTNLWPARLSSQWWQNMIASSSTLVYLLRSPTVLKLGNLDKISDNQTDRNIHNSGYLDIYDSIKSLCLF